MSSTPDDPERAPADEPAHEQPVDPAIEGAAGQTPAAPPRGENPTPAVPPAQPPAYPAGAYPPGAYPPGASAPGAYPPGAYPPGAYPPGAYPPGAYAQSYAPPPRGSQPLGVGAGAGIGCGLHFVAFFFGLLLLSAGGGSGIGFFIPFMVIAVGAIVMMFFPQTRKLATGMLIIVAAAWLIVLGPCLGLVTQY